ncbi:MAG: hypothetical protein JO257_17335 [Deltaproteobacteria bacterium]|nr:hypothetical protein [Deltaproteobacteria bacterium]
MTDRRFATLIAISLLVVTVASRLVPHPWNFTPMIAVALFAGARIERGWAAMLAVVGCLALGDLAIGVFPYDGMIWVYAPMLAIALVGRLLVTRRSALATLVAALGAGLLFFVVSNFGVWLGTLYAHTPAGLADCYIAALPFYRNQIVGDLVFTGALFGLHAAAMNLRARAVA